jgi:ATP-dependent protease ClpP protease subunit
MSACLFKLKNEAKGPCEILMYEPIGRDPWAEGGFTAANLQEVLTELDPKQELCFRINSMGGDVYEGLAIKSIIDGWQGRTTAKVDGIAASTASWVCSAVDSVEAAEGAQVFIHEPWANVTGNSADMRKAWEALDKTGNTVAGFYAKRCNKPVAEMREMMKAETLFTAEEAKAIGLVDTIANEKAQRNFTQHEIRNIKNRLAQLNFLRTSPAPESVAAKPKAPMEKTENSGNAATTEPNADVIEMKNEIAAMKSQLAAGQQSHSMLLRAAVVNRVDKLVADNKIPLPMRDETVERAIKDESILTMFDKMPPVIPGIAGEPKPSNIVSLGAAKDALDAFKAQKNIMSNYLGANAGNALTPQVMREYREKGVAFRNELTKHHNSLVAQWNTTNTLDSEFKRSLILMGPMLEAYKVVMMQLTGFATVFSEVALEGNDYVTVPYFALQTAAATSWAAGTGYVATNTAQSMKKVLVGGLTASSGSSAAANTACDRKYLGMQFTSAELARYPYLNVEKLGVQNARKLAVDIFTDIVSRVITVGNFGAAGKTLAAAQFSSDDVADLWATATSAYWPTTNRTIVLDHTYMLALLKSAAFRNVSFSGTSDALIQGVIKSMYGFQNVFCVPNLTTYTPTAENLAGWINHESAVLVATAQVVPSEEVRVKLSRFEVISDPDTGISFAYRAYGDPQLDTAGHYIECSYGAAVGVAEALSRITSA